ncbi:MAG: YceI family protein [Candidatus Kapaibacteriota bacterium]
MYYIVLITVVILFSTFTSLAQNVVLNNEKSKTKITYELRHPAHNVRGVSDDLQVKIEYDKSNNSIKQVIAQVRVTSFNSGNSNRDSHAMELIEAQKYPKAFLKSTKIVEFADSLVCYADLTFHGVTKNITINARKKFSVNILNVNGNFAISLDEFKVERPKLLFVPSEEYLRFEFSVSFVIN